MSRQQRFGAIGAGVAAVLAVIAVLACIIGVTVIDVFLSKGAESRGAIRWGEMPERSQHAIFVLAIKNGRICIRIVRRLDLSSSH